MPNNTNVKPARKNNAGGNNASKANARNGNLAKANGNVPKANNAKPANAPKANNAPKSNNAAKAANAGTNTPKTNDKSARKRHNARGWYKGGKRGRAVGGMTTSELRRTTGMTYDASGYFGSVMGFGLGGLTSFGLYMGGKSLFNQEGWTANGKQRANGLTNFGVGAVSLLAAPALRGMPQQIATGIAGTSLAIGVVEFISSFISSDEDRAAADSKKLAQELLAVAEKGGDLEAIKARAKELGVSGPDLSALLSDVDEQALQADLEARVNTRLNAVGDAYNDLVDDLDNADLGDPGFDDVVVLDTIEHHLAQMRFSLQNGDVAFENGDLHGADAFATVAVQQGLAAEALLTPLTQAAAVQDVIDTIVTPEAEVSNMMPAAVQGYPLEIPVLNGRVEGELMVSAPHPDSIFGPGQTTGSRAIDFDILNAWAQDASSRVNAQINAQPGQPGYTTPEQMALAYLYWFDLYTNRRGYIYGLQQMQAQAPGTWSGSGYGDVSGANPAFAASAMPTFLTVRGQPIPCGMGTGQELATVVHQLYGGQ